MALFGKKEERAEPRQERAPARREDRPATFLPRREARPRVESVFVRLVATGGIIGIGVMLAAILGSQEVASWIVGIVVAGVTVILAAILWSSRSL